ncbi:hypothetical protein [Ekhidna sp.]
MLRKLLKRLDKDSLRLKKTESDEWMVHKGTSILYIGTKEKCETFRNHQEGI